MYTEHVPQERIRKKIISAEKITLQPGDATRYEFIVALNATEGWPLVEIALLNFAGGGFALSFDSRFLWSVWQEIKDLPLHEQVKNTMTKFVRDSMPSHCNNLYTARALVEASIIFLHDIGVEQISDLDNSPSGDAFVGGEL